MRAESIQTFPKKRHGDKQEQINPRKEKTHSGRLDHTGASHHDLPSLPDGKGMMHRNDQCLCNAVPSKP